MSAPVLTNRLALPLRLEPTERPWHSGAVTTADDTVPSLKLVVDECNALRAERDAALAEVARLRAGMEAWARDEDGIHPDAYPAYCSAGLLLGIEPKEVQP